MGFYKVAQSGGSYVVATFYNPNTGEERTKRVRDYDYGDGSRDDDELYYMEIDEEVRKIWLHKNGVILPGDRVKVVKGRKIPKGTEAVVERFFDWKDQYGRVQTRYVIFTDGRKTSVSNLVLITEEGE